MKRSAGAVCILRLEEMIIPMTAMVIQMDARCLKYLYMTPWAGNRLLNATAQKMIITIQNCYRQCFRPAINLQTTGITCPSDKNHILIHTQAMTTA